MFTYFTYIIISESNNHLIIDLLALLVMEWNNLVDLMIK